MEETLYFANKSEFEYWLKVNHGTAKGIHIYIYKKGHEDEGITYEEALRTALCYGWIDSVVHKDNEKRFRQYYAPRQKRSNWALSNKIRMRDLIAEGKMTEEGLKYFDISWLDNLDEEIESEERAKHAEVVIPDFIKYILEQDKALEDFKKETKSAQRRYIEYIKQGKKEETRIRRSHKIAQMVKGETAKIF